MKNTVLERIEVFVPHCRKYALSRPGALGRRSARLPDKPEHGSSVHFLNSVQGRHFAVAAKNAPDSFFEILKQRENVTSLTYDLSHARVCLVLGASPSLGKENPDLFRIVQCGIKFLNAGNNLIHVRECVGSNNLVWAVRVQAYFGTRGQPTHHR
jgi:hypothetical protein